MSKDVRIEILYYKTPTDVALEFGIRGNYPLRLLSSNCQDINSFFLSLKRAVSRSEIIIIVGGYSKKDYLPTFIARSIGKKCFTPNYNDYDIVENYNLIPEGAIPLAPKSKLFGGFLIEHGPQTIISLTDDKTVRNEVVEEFVVKYIAEHHYVFTHPTVTDNNTNDDNSKDAPQIQEEFNDISSTTETDNESDLIVEQNDDQVSLDNNNDDADEIDVVTDISADNDIDTDNITVSDTNAVIDTDNLDVLINKRYLNVDQDDYEDEDELGTDEDNYYIEKHKSRHQKKIVRAICLILSLAILLGMSAMLYLYPEDIKTINDGYYQRLSATFDSLNSDPSDAFHKIQSVNKNFFTWLSLNSKGINHPVLTVDKIDNRNDKLFMLPNGIKNEQGSLFSTTSCSPNIAPKNTFIYGSAYQNGIFEKLSNYENLIGNIIKTSDVYFQAEWKIFSTFNDSDLNDFDYSKTNFENTTEYIEYLNGLKELSIKECDVDFNGLETLIFLVGITNNKRYITVAYLTSVRILKISSPVINNNSSSSSSNATSSDGSSNNTESEEIFVEDDYYGDTPDIVLPTFPNTSSNSSTTSSNVQSSGHTSSSLTSNSTSGTSSGATSSQHTSTESSSPSSNTSSQPSSSNVSSSRPSSSNISNSQPSSSSVSSTMPSSSADTSTGSSSIISSVISSATSSITSSTVNKPTVDPIFTWDVERSIIDSATGIKYTADATTLVAMIIEDEMSPTIDPPEALIAQAIVKYNWLINNTQKGNIPSNALDPNPTKQALQYAAEAKGEVLLYNNTLAKTYCHSYSAGYTAAYHNIWSGGNYPYLQGVECSVDNATNVKDFETTTVYSAELIKNLINHHLNIDVSDMPKEDWLKPTKYDNNDTYCVEISIGGKVKAGTYLRNTLLKTVKNNGTTVYDVKTIRSSAYKITYNSKDDTFTVVCRGYGHGVGLSQRGAKAYAKMGWTHEQILAHFFPGTNLIVNK